MKVALSVPVLIIGMVIEFSLQVLGAVGATWGASDALRLHTNKEDENWQDDIGWRICALIIGSFAFIRFLSLVVPEKKLCPSIVAFHSPSRFVREQRNISLSHTRLFIGGGFVIELILKVAGCTGAIWGTSEFIGLKNNDNQNVCDRTALILGAFALCKFVSDYCPDNHYKSLLSMGKFGVVIDFILQVPGAGGALWGFTKVVNVRNDNNGDIFAKASFIILCIGWLKFILDSPQYHDRQRNASCCALSLKAFVDSLGFLRNNIFAVDSADLDLTAPLLPTSAPPAAAPSSVAPPAEAPSPSPSAVAEAAAPPAAAPSSVAPPAEAPSPSPSAVAEAAAPSAAAPAAAPAAEAPLPSSALGFSSVTPLRTASDLAATLEGR